MGAPPAETVLDLLDAGLGAELVAVGLDRAADVDGADQAGS